MGHSSVPVGLFSEKSTPYSFLQNARPPGSLRSPSEPRTVLSSLCAFPVGLFSVCAPKPSFRRFRCSAWLIQLRQRTALSPLKRSCFSRFAASEPRTVLAFLCAFRGGLFSVCAPKPSFRRFRCSAWLIQLRQRTALSPLKRSCFRFASLTLRTPHRPPVSSPLAAAAALWLPCVRGAVRRRAGLRGCLRVRGKGKGRRPSPVSAPNRLFKPLRCSGRLIRQAETLDLQPLRGLHRSTVCFFFQNAHAPGSLRSPSVSAPKPSFRRFRCSAWLIFQKKHTVLFLPKRSCFRFTSLTLRTAHRNLFSEDSGVPHGLFCDSAPSPIRAPVFRRAYWLRQTLRLQPLRGLHQSTLCFFFQNAHAPGSLRSPSEPRTVLPFLLH